MPSLSSDVDIKITHFGSTANTLMLLGVSQSTLTHMIEEQDTTEFNAGFKSQVTTIQQYELSLEGWKVKTAEKSTTHMDLDDISQKTIASATCTVEAQNDTKKYTFQATVSTPFTPISGAAGEKITGNLTLKSTGAVTVADV